jgi:uncharacterized protein (DUF1697 family)
MAVVIAMLRGVNVGGNNRLPMEALRALCLPLGLRGVQTYIQSGNLVFYDATENPAASARLLEEAIHKKFGFKPAVVVRTPADLRKVIAKNPFAGRAEVAPNRLLVVFLDRAPTRQARDQVLALKRDPEEMHLNGRELYIHYPHGMARPTIPVARIEKMLQCTTTARNLNTVQNLLAMAHTMEAAGA